MPGTQALKPVISIYLTPKMSALIGKVGGKTMGFSLQRGMGYGLLRTYGLWYAISREPSWWISRAMGYKGLWVFRGMGYEGFNCNPFCFSDLMDRCRPVLPLLRPFCWCGLAGIYSFAA